MRDAIVMFAAGLGVPMLAALNAALGQRLGSPVLAAMVLFAVALVTVAAAALALAPRPWPALLGQSAHLYLAGGLIAFYVLSITWVAPRFGVGNAVFFVLLGQLVSAAIIDRFGLFGALPTPLSPQRVLGIAVMAAGLGLALKA